MMMDNYGITPVYDVTGNGSNSNGSNAWGDGGWIWIIFLFFLMAWGGNWGNNGFGNAGAQGALTRGDLCMDMNFSDVQNGVRNISDAVNLGFSNLNSTICHQQYDTAMLINGVNATLNNGFSGVNSAICQQQYETANLLNQMNIANMQSTNALQSQIADCCCQEQRAIDNVNYNMSQNTCNILNAMNSNTRDIIDTQNAGTRAILDYLCQDKIQTLQNENQSLKLAASQANQNIALGAMMDANTAEILRRTAPTPIPAYAVNPPYPYYGFYNNSGCGCNSGCNSGCGCGSF